MASASEKNCCQSDFILCQNCIAKLGLSAPGAPNLEGYQLALQSIDSNLVAFHWYSGLGLLLYYSKYWRNNSIKQEIEWSDISVWSLSGKTFGH